MSDEEPDFELLELLRASLAAKANPNTSPSDIRVLKDAEYIYDNAVDVAIDSASTKAAAEFIWISMESQGFSLKTWSAHELHPKTKDEATVMFIFTLDLLNFSFWPEEAGEESFMVEYRGKQWTGYWSLVAVLHRALEEEIPITDPHFWINQNECDDQLLEHVFRSSSVTPIPLLPERIQCLRRAGRVLYQEFECSFFNCLRACNASAATLVDLLTRSFEDFRDEARFQGRIVRFYKRAQILVADLWACFEAESYGRFEDIDRITMFADYRVPQLLQSMGCLRYAPSLESHIKALKEIENGHEWEMQLRGCSIWCVELICREIRRKHPEAKVNAILVDFFLYDTAKQREADEAEMLPHHRTRCIWY